MFCCGTSAPKIMVGVLLAVPFIDPTTEPFITGSALREEEQQRLTGTTAVAHRHRLVLSKQGENSLESSLSSKRSPV